MDDVLLDTFDDEQVGMPPVSPDIGSYFGVPLGEQTIVDPGDGDLRLRCNDDSAAGGCRFTFEPTGSLERAVTEYLFRVEEGASSAGANDFDQQLVLSPSGTNLSIEWSAFIGQLGIRIAAAGGETQFFVPGFQWVAGTDYLVEVETDATTDTYTVTINDELLVDDDLGADFSALDRLSFRTGFSALGAQQIDDVRIAMLPEPSPGWLAAASVASLAWRARRRPGPRVDAATGPFAGARRASRARSQPPRRLRAPAAPARPAAGSRSRVRSR